MRTLTRALTVLTLVTAFAAVTAAQAVNVTGTWTFTVETGQGSGNPTLTFKQDGENITGTYEGRYGKSALEGTVKENHVEFIVTVVAEGTTVSGAFVGDVEKDRMTGTVEYEGAGDGTWSAVRIPEKK